MLPISSITSPSRHAQAPGIAPLPAATINPISERRPSVSSTAANAENLTRVRWEPVEIQKESMSFRSVTVMRPVRLRTVQLASTSVAIMLAKFEEMQHRLTFYAGTDLSAELLKEIRHRKILIAGQIAELKFDRRMRFCEPTPEYVDVGNKATALLNRLQRIAPSPPQAVSEVGAPRSPDPKTPPFRALARLR